MAPHVPAWKRLGLQLKNAPETAVPQPPSQPALHGESELNGANGSPATPTTKKRKLDKITDDGANKSFKRRKSVAFTPETKKDDGDSAQKYFKEWVEEQKGADADFTPEQVAEFLPPPSTHPANQDDLAAPSEKPSKKEKKQAKKDRKATQQPESAGLPVYLQYLQQYHSDRASWKFSKAKQIDLLKNIFNIFRIPPEHDDALKDYIAGLQGQAARSRLRETAEQVIRDTEDSDSVPDEGPMDSLSARAEVYKQALLDRLNETKRRLRNEAAKEYEESDEFRLKLRKRKRAEEVLLALAASDTTQPASSNEPARAASAGMTNGAGHIKFDDDDDNDATAKPDGPQKKRRARKSRTGVPDNDQSDASSVKSIPSAAESSSDGSSDDPDSDSSSSPEKSSSSSSESSDAESEASSSSSSSSSAEESESGSGSDSD